MIGRRQFITLLGGAAAALPLAARGQQAALPVIGYLRFGEQRADAIGALRKGLSEQGYFEGRNFVFEPRTAEDYDRLPALAAELVARRVAAIFTFPPANAAQAAKAATSVIPIVFTTGADPILQGLVASLNRPGANVTGVTVLDMGPKQLELLRGLVPKASTIAYLANPVGTGTELATQNVLAAARSVGQHLIVLNASTPAEIDTAFATLARERAGGCWLSLMRSFLLGTLNSSCWRNAMPFQRSIPALNFQGQAA